MNWCVRQHYNIIDWCIDARHVSLIIRFTGLRTRESKNNDISDAPIRTSAHVILLSHRSNMIQWLQTSRSSSRIWLNSESSHVQQMKRLNQSINQSINNWYRAIVQRRLLQCGLRNVLRPILNVLTDGAVRQFSGRVQAP